MSKLIVVLGLVAVLVNSGVLDEAGFHLLVRHSLTVDASALTRFGHTTEFYKLTDHERSRI
jgi:dihydrodipicolinate synthase/N-acetylneuraminate lyase